MLQIARDNFSRFAFDVHAFFSMKKFKLVEHRILDRVIDKKVNTLAPTSFDKMIEYGEYVFKTKHNNKNYLLVYKSGLNLFDRSAGIEYFEPAYKLYAVFINNEDCDLFSFKKEHYSLYTEAIKLEEELTYNQNASHYVYDLIFTDCFNKKQKTIEGVNCFYSDEDIADLGLISLGQVDYTNVRRFSVVEKVRSLLGF